MEKKEVVENKKPAILDIFSCFTLESKYDSENN